MGKLHFWANLTPCSLQISVKFPDEVDPYPVDTDTLGFTWRPYKHAEAARDRPPIGENNRGR